MPQTREKFIKLMEMKFSRQYSYNFGQNYPLHRSCCNIERGAGDDCSSMVPKHMGWRWDEPIFGKKWYPGHINRTVRCLMKHVLNPFPVDTLPLTRRDRFGRVIRALSDCNPTVAQKPTLQIKKKDDEYCITMNPLKDKTKLETDYNPYLDCSPLTIKIKKRPEEAKRHRAKKLLRERGFYKKCSCLNLRCCRCMTPAAKKLLSYEIKNVTAQMKLKNQLQFEDLCGSSDSELDMQFTTPSAVVHDRKLKPNVTHCGTQYTAKDIDPPKIKVCAVEGNVKSKKKNLKASTAKNPKASTANLSKAAPRAFLKSKAK